METNEQERVRAAVRESYGKIARDNGANAETIQADCGCGCEPDRFLQPSGGLFSV